MTLAESHRRGGFQSKFVAAATADCFQTAFFIFVGLRECASSEMRTGETMLMYFIILFVPGNY